MSSRSTRTLQLVAGQVLGQLCIVGIIPILTRSYAPVVLGTYQAAMAVAMTVQPLASLRSEFVLPSLRHDRSAQALYRLALVSTSGIVAVTALAAAVLWYLSLAIAPSVFMAALLIAALALTVLDNAKLLRLRAEGRLAARNLLAGLFTAGLQLGVAFANLPVEMLALAFLVGRLLAILVTSSRGRSFDLADIGEEPHPYGMRRASLAVASGVTATATAQMFTATSAPALGPEASGFVGVSQRIAGLPIGLLGQGLAQALQSRTATTIRAGRAGLRRQVSQQIATLSGVAALTSAALIIFAPPLAGPLLGPEWVPAGTVIAILAIPLSFQLVIGPLMPLLPMLAKEHLLLFIQLSRFILVGGTLAASFAVGLELNSTAFAFAGATIAGYLLMIAILWIEVSKYERDRRSPP